MKLNKIIQIIERKTFLYYNDINNNTLYIPRFIYDECMFHKIELNSKPKILGDRNYYSITREQLQELEEKSNFKGIEKIIRLNKEDHSAKLNDVIFAYKDGITGILYIPQEYAEQTSGNSKTILGKKCKAIYIRELEKILNKKIYIVTVFLKPKEESMITLCKTEDRVFIKEEDAISYGLNLMDRKRIKVDGILFIQISPEEITLMNIIATKEDKRLSFIEKKIIPKKR